MLVCIRNPDQPLAHHQWGKQLLQQSIPSGWDACRAILH